MPVLAPGRINVAPLAPTMQRSFATASVPKTLSLRMDGLFVQCFIAAVLYFGPQDAVFLLGLGWILHTKAATVSPKSKQADAEAAVEAFKAVSMWHLWHRPCNAVLQ